MYFKDYKAITFLLTFCFSITLQGQVYINEFMASNNTGITDASGAYEDWVELYNAGSTAVDIGGWYASDDLGDPTQWQIPTGASAETTIAPGGFLILWFDKDTDEGVLHVDAKLGSGGEEIIFTAADGTTTIDSYTFGQQTTDVSEGRTSDGGAVFGFFTTPTPGASNAVGSQIVEDPVFSAPGGLYAEPVLVGISSPTAGAYFRYTTDGSEPDDNSAFYSGPLTLSDPTALRAKAFKDGFEPSGTITSNYLVGISHAFPIIAVTGENSDFYDEETGIFGNIEEDIEIVINAEFYEPDGTLGFNQLIEAELQGVSSASNAQKSLALKAKGSLGNSKFDYPVFPDLEYDSYRSLVLRNSGNDWAVTGFRDAMVTSLVRDLSDTEDLIETPRVYTQGYRPSILYINGAYHGVYNLRERTDKGYIRTRFGLEEDEIDFLEGMDEVREGDVANWDSLKTFLEENEFSGEENFNDLATRIDIEHFLDYATFNVLVDNQDWPGNNYRRFRERSPDGQWRWLSYDLDFSYGLFTSAGWNTGYAGDNSIGRLLNPNGLNWPNPTWGTLLFERLVENDTWRTNFINRSADMMNVLMNPVRVNERIDEFLETYAPEYDQQNATWSNWFNQEANADILRDFANDRPDFLKPQYVEAFDDITGTADITISTQPSAAGEIYFSTLKIDEEDDVNAWTGTYFTGVDIPAKVIAKPGFIFQNWSGYSNSSEQELNVVLSEDIALTAVFIQGSTGTEPIVINEINYNSSDDNNTGDWLELYNPNAEAVDISGWYVMDAAGKYYNFPANTLLAAEDYLVLAEDFAEFTYTVDNLYGEFGNNSPFGEMKFSNSGDLIQLFNAAGVLIDSVEYDDESPWVEEPDGDGPTLQLMSPELDNSLAENWAAWAPTPGAENINSVLAEECVLNLEAEVLPGGQIRLLWFTNQQSLIDSFYVERSEGSLTFETIHELKNVHTENPNPVIFQYVDEAPPSGQLYFHIRKVLFSGETGYSNPISLNFDFDSEGLELFPNPIRTEDYITLQLGSNFSGQSEILLSNSLGQVISVIETEEQQNSVHISTTNMTEGTYYLQINSEGTRARTLSFIKL